jgi:hypothetical protein
MDGSKGQVVHVNLDLFGDSMVVVGGCPQHVQLWWVRMCRTRRFTQASGCAPAASSSGRVSRCVRRASRGMAP